jgi:drug/metabolite transporter (DMT)-like permease
VASNTVGSSWPSTMEAPAEATWASSAGVDSNACRTPQFTESGSTHSKASSASAPSVAGLTPTVTHSKSAVRRKIAFYVTVVCFGFGISMFLNGIATKLLPESALVSTVVCQERHKVQAAAAAAGGAPTDSTMVLSPPLGLYILASMLEPIYMLAAGRAVALAMILVLWMWWTRRKAAKPGAIVEKAAPEIVSKRLLLPIAIGITNSIAYACYMALTSLAGVSIWSAMVGCYVIMPASYGIFIRGESRGTKKIAGIVCCAVAAIMLGMAGTSSDQTIEADTQQAEIVVVDGPWFLKLFLYGGAILFWSFSDGISAYMLKPPKPSVDNAPVVQPLSVATVISFTAVGFAVSAACIAGITMLMYMHVRAPGVCPEVDTSSASGGYVTMLFAQLLGKIAWMSLIQLGTIGEASSFIPLIGLDVFIPSILGIIVLHESVGAIGYVGMVLAAVGVALISTAT